MRPTRLLHLLWVAAAACNEPPRPAFTELPAPRRADPAPLVSAQTFGSSSTEAKLTFAGRRVEVTLPATLHRSRVEVALEQGRVDAGELHFEFAAAADLQGSGAPTSLQLSWSADSTSVAPSEGATHSTGARRSHRRVQATLLFNQHRSEQTLTLRLWQRPGQATTLAGDLRFDLLPHGLTLSTQPSDETPARNGSPQPLQNARLSFEMALEPAAPAASAVIAVAEP